MSENPYQTSANTSFSDTVPQPQSGNVDLGRTADMLRQTKPWVRFISVMMFIGSAFMVLGGVLMAARGDMFGELGTVGFVMGATYIGMALCYVIPAVFLWNYADRISVFIQQRSTFTLAAALQSQKSFWKFVGVMLVIVLFIYLGFFFLAFAAF